MPTVPNLPAAATPGDTDLLWATQGMGSDRNRKMTLAALKGYTSDDVAAAIEAEVIRAEAAEATILAGISSSNSLANPCLIDLSITGVYALLTGASSGFFRVVQLSEKSFSFSLRANYATSNICTVGHVVGWGLSLGGSPSVAEVAFYAAIAAYGAAFEISSNAFGAVPQHITVEPSVGVYGFNGILFRGVPSYSFASTDAAFQSATISGTLIFP